MLILHVIRQFPPSIGGLENYAKNMALHQQKRGHLCNVLTLNKIFTHENEGILPSIANIDGLPVKRISFLGKQRFFIPFVSIRYLRQFDLIHVHNTDGFFDTLAILSPFIRRPMVATSHGGFFHTKNFSLIKKFYFHIVTRLTIKAYHKMFAISSNDFKTFKQLTNRIVLQPNAVEPLGDFTATGQDFIYIGRLAKHKNVNKLIETFAAYVHTHAGRGNLHIVGPEWDVKRADLSALAQQLSITDRIHIHGFISPEEMADVLKKCGYFVSASLFEGFGMSMIEAMSVGLIPFVQPNESFLELSEQAKLGECLDFTNPQQAAASLHEAIKNGTTAEQRAAARAFSTQFSWDKLIEDCLAVYKECGAE